MKSEMIAHWFVMTNDWLGRASLIIAAGVYKFGRFTLECVAFLDTEL